jgi:hypothetical protein
MFWNELNQTAPDAFFRDNLLIFSGLAGSFRKIARIQAS